MVLASFGVNAQTYYYQHTKTVYSNGNSVVQNGQSGQFVCRTNAYGQARCYDCTKNGRDHLNGTLFYIGKRGNTEVYKGKSYFGEGTTYQFDDSRGILNIKDANGNVYVYKKATAPSGRTESSLVASWGTREGYDPWDYYVDPIDHSYDSSPSNSSASSNKKRGSSKSIKKHSTACPTCHGQGRIRAHVGTGTYGVSSKKKHCNVCGKDYYVSEDHWHVCPTCHGR